MDVLIPGTDMETLALNSTLSAVSSAGFARPHRSIKKAAVWYSLLFPKQFVKAGYNLGGQGGDADEMYSTTAFPTASPVDASTEGSNEANTEGIIDITKPESNGGGSNTQGTTSTDQDQERGGGGGGGPPPGVAGGTTSIDGDNGLRPGGMVAIALGGGIVVLAAIGWHARQHQQRMQLRDQEDGASLTIDPGDTSPRSAV